MSTPKTPIAIFTYNRPRHTETVLQSLSLCAGLEHCCLHIYCDGPKNPEQRDEVTASRQVVREWAERLDARVIEQETNVGLARSIVRGVTELCKQYGRVIVIEDDLVLNPAFVNYMLQALHRYQDEANVYQISGYMFPLEHPERPDAFFLPLTTTWGWATWDRAWQVFDWNAAGAAEMLRDPKLRRLFDLDNSYPYSAMLADRLKNQNDSWGILFWWAVFKAGGVVLHPRQSLVWNRGFDGSGTHCAAPGWSDDPTAESIAGTDLDFVLPDAITIDEAAFDRIKRFLRRGQSPQTLTGKIWRRLERYAAGAQNRSDR